MHPQSHLPQLVSTPSFAFCFNLSSSWIAPCKYNAILSEHDSVNAEKVSSTDAQEADRIPKRSIWVKPGSRILQRSSLTASKNPLGPPKFIHRQLGMSNECRALITSVLNSDDPVSVLERVGDELQDDNFNIILREFGIRRDWENVCKVFEWMRAKSKANAPSFTSFISLMRKAGHPEKALRVYSSLQGTDLRRNPFICNSLLKTLIDTGSVEKAFTLFEQQKREGYIPDLVSYSTMLAACAKYQNGYSKALSFLEEMRERGLRPDSFVYASMLNICAVFGLEDEAETTFEKLKEDGIDPNVFHYSCLLNMYAEKGKAEEAERVVLNIKGAGFGINMVILHLLMKAYINSGLLKKARNILDEMESYGFRATEVSYCLLLDGYTKAGCGDDAQTLFDQMKAKGIQPGSYTYSILISYYSKAGKVENVKALAKEINGKPSNNWDMILYNILLKAYCEWGCSEEISDTLEKMAHGGLQPDRATLNILIVHFSKEKMFELAIRTLEDLKKRNLRPNLNTYVPIISGLVDEGRIDEALHLFEEMQRQSIVPSVRLFETVVEGLCKEKRPTEALRLLNEMKAFKMAIPPTCLESFLIAARSRIELIKELVTEDAHFLASLERVNYSAVFHAFEEEGSYNELYGLLEYMKSLNFIQNKERLDQFIAQMQQSGNADVVTQML